MFVMLQQEPASSKLELIAALLAVHSRQQNSYAEDACSASAAASRIQNH